MKQKAALFLLLLLWSITILINLLPFFDGSDALMDFGSFYASGLKTAHGENPYGTDSEYIFEISFSSVGAGGTMMNLNPPISAMIFALLARFDAHKSLIIWQILSAALYATSVFVLARQWRPAPIGLLFWSFSLAGFWHTLVLGQLYILLFAFTVFAWLWLNEGKYIRAGIAIGLLIAIKPNFILWPLFVLLAGYSVTVFVSMITAACISLLPLLVYGWEIYAQWLHASALQTRTLIMPGNNSLMGLTARFDSMEIGILLSITLLGLLLYRFKRMSENQNRTHELASSLGILVSLLASPISWTGYTILLLPIYFSFKRWTPALHLSAGILCIPFAIVLQLFQRSTFNFVFFGWLYGWASLLLLAVLVTKRTDDSAPALT